MLVSFGSFKYIFVVAAIFFIIILLDKGSQNIFVATNFVLQNQSANSNAATFQVESWDKNRELMNLERQVLKNKQRIYFPDLVEEQELDGIPQEYRYIVDIFSGQAGYLAAHKIFQSDTNKFLGYKIFFSVDGKMGYNKVGGQLSRLLAKSGMNFYWNEHYGFAEANSLLDLDTSNVKFEWIKDTAVGDYHISLLINTKR